MSDPDAGDDANLSPGPAPAPNAGAAPSSFDERAALAKHLQRITNRLPVMPEARDHTTMHDWFRQCESMWRAASGFDQDVLWLGSTPSSSIASALAEADKHNELSAPARSLHPHVSLELTNAFFKTIPLEVRLHVPSMVEETPLLAWKDIKSALLGTPFQRLAAAQQRLYNMTPTSRLTHFLVEWKRCFSEVQRLAGNKGPVNVTAAEVATMRAAICKTLPDTSPFLLKFNSCETLGQLEKYCAKFDAMYPAGFTSQPRPAAPVAARATKTAAAAGGRTRICFTCGSAEHTLVKDCPQFRAIAERMWQKPKEGFAAMRAAASILQRGAPSGSDLAMAEYIKPSKYIVPARRSDKAAPLHVTANSAGILAPSTPPGGPQPSASPLQPAGASQVAPPAPDRTAQRPLAGTAAPSPHQGTGRSNSGANSCAPALGPQGAPCDFCSSQMLHSPRGGGPPSPLLSGATGRTRASAAMLPH